MVANVTKLKSQADIDNAYNAGVASVPEPMSTYKHVEGWYGSKNNNYSFTTYSPLFHIVNVKGKTKYSGGAIVGVVICDSGSVSYYDTVSSITFPSGAHYFVFKSAYSNSTSVSVKIT